MGYYHESEMLKAAIEITNNAVSNAGDKAAHIVANPDLVAEFVQTVYNKLVEINDELG